MDKFDVIIVGAGLAGLGAAYTLAGSGLEVLVLERGDYPGAKNVSGGRIYLNPIRDLYPSLFDVAPLERFITHEGISLMAKERSVYFEYSGNELRNEPHQSYSILRSKFDRWLAERVEEKGIMLLTKTRVDEVIRNNGQIAGVVAGGDELGADVVIACDGVVSLLSEKAGLRSRGLAHDFALGIKEVIALDPGLINDRFSLDGNEGSARLFVGEVTHGKFGGGFLYTNRDSISLGIVVGIEDAMGNNPPIDVPDLLEKFKSRPEIAPLIRGGGTTEYSAHIIPEGGFKALGSLYGNGILVAGDAAGLALNIGFTVRGMEYALASGYFAAQAVLKAKESGNFSAGTLGVYKELLEESFVLCDVRNFQETPAVIANPRFFSHYPELIGNLMKDIYTVPAGLKEKIYPTIRKHVTLGELWAMLKDMRGVMKI
ncbi:MAG TPA: FAD-dependent oxidoreductase [Syntrophales bacterium]|nr:FAD-dependent oxidoreductase [Syntrophales bacterium]